MSVSNKKHCYPLTITDQMCRYLLACEALEWEDAKATESARQASAHMNEQPRKAALVKGRNVQGEQGQPR